MEHHCKNLLPTWGLEPASRVSVNMLIHKKKKKWEKFMITLIEIYKAIV